MHALLSKTREDNSQSWLDQPIPILDNETPRIASTSREGRICLNKLLDFYEQMTRADSFNANPSREWVYQQLSIGPDPNAEPSVGAAGLCDDECSICLSAGSCSSYPQRGTPGPLPALTGNSRIRLDSSKCGFYFILFRFGQTQG